MSGCVDIRNFYSACDFQRVCAYIARFKVKPKFFGLSTLCAEALVILF